MRETLIQDLEEAENCCVYLEDLPDDIMQVRMMRTFAKMLYHILTWLVKAERRRERGNA